MLQPLAGRPPFRQIRELERRVQPDCAVEIDTNAYSVPWWLIGESVRVVIAEGRVSIRHQGREVAVHAKTAGRQRVVDPAHLSGIGRAPASPATSLPPPSITFELLRPLSEYERAIGAGWR